MSGPLAPRLLQARLTPKLWGGRRLAAWGRDLPAGQVIGECAYDCPPLLLKLIDANQDLSVQVHPDDELARRLHGPQASGKSEMWVVLEAAPGAMLMNGFKPGTRPEDFEAALAAGRVAELLNRFTVRPGDVVEIPAGRIHAVGAGCLVAEVQQSSDLTYRVWDYGRLEDGRPRALHLDAARQALRFGDLGCRDGRLQPAGIREIWGLREPLVLNGLFAVERWTLERAQAMPPARPHASALLLLGGALAVEGGGARVPLAPGDAALLPPGPVCSLVPLGPEPARLLWAQA